jgi:hypothetical protein
LLVAGALLFVRFASHDIAQWHVDPLTAPTPETPNSWRVAPPGQSPGAAGQESPIYRASPAELMAAFDRIALAQPKPSVWPARLRKASLPMSSEHRVLSIQIIYL